MLLIRILLLLLLRLNRRAIRIISVSIKFPRYTRVIRQSILKEILASKRLHAFKSGEIKRVKGSEMEIHGSGGLTVEKKVGNRFNHGEI